MKKIFVFLILPVSLYSQNIIHKPLITWECKNDSSIKQLNIFLSYKFNFNFESTVIDTSTYNLGVMVKDNLLKKSYNFKNKFYHTTINSDEIVFKYCLKDKNTNQIVYEDSITQKAEYHSDFDIKWLEMEYQKLPTYRKTNPLQNEMIANLKKIMLVNKKAPFFEFEDLLGELNTSFDTLNNKATLIYFTSSSCGPCILEKKSIDSLSIRYKNKVRFIMVYNDISKKDLLNLRQRNTNFEIVYDKNKSIHQLYYVSSWPTKFFIQNSKVKYVSTGAMVYDKESKKLIQKNSFSQDNFSFHESKLKNYLGID